MCNRILALRWNCEGKKGKYTLTRTDCSSLSGIERNVVVAASELANSELAPRRKGPRPRQTGKLNTPNNWIWR
jgi:hypothetical protein